MNRRAFNTEERPKIELSRELMQELASDPQNMDPELLGMYLVLCVHNKWFDAALKFLGNKRTDERRAISGWDFMGQIIVDGKAPAPTDTAAGLLTHMGKNEVEKSERKAWKQVKKLLKARLKASGQGHHDPRAEITRKQIQAVYGRLKPATLVK